MKFEGLAMKIILGIKNIKKLYKPVVAMGVFDGLHRGHRQILKDVIIQAAKIKGVSVVLTFWPHPQKEESLYSLEHRLQLIEELGIDECIVINFSKHFAKINPAHFVRDILFKRIGTRYIYVGKDFRFGREARGDFALLESLGKNYNFQVKGFDIIKVNNRPIRSTLIRTLIRAGRLMDAQKLLGRPVSILGTVIKGTALGRLLGFPTANINPHHEVIPALGIYAVKITLGKDKLKGVCYIGTRPTIDTKNKRVNVEVHIFNFDKNIYGKDLEIQFVKLIRLDRKFSSLVNLARQIKKDIVLAKKVIF